MIAMPSPKATPIARPLNCSLNKSAIIAANIITFQGNCHSREASSKYALSNGCILVWDSGCGGNKPTAIPAMIPKTHSKTFLGSGRRKDMLTLLPNEPERPIKPVRFFVDRFLHRRDGEQLVHPPADREITIPSPILV